MSKNNKKGIGILFALIILGLIVYYPNKRNTENVRNNLTCEQKKNLKYNFEIPNDLHVLDIISENELLVEKENQLKIYDLEKEEFNEESIDITRGYYTIDAIYFDNGVIWIEIDKNGKATNKILINYFSEGKTIELDESNSDILPSITSTANYLTYYVGNNNYISIKLFDLKEKSNKIISTYKLINGEDKMFVSDPNTNDYEVVWSGTINDKSNVFIYNIKEDTLNKLSEDSVAHNPVIKNDRIFAIKMCEFYDSEIDSNYASNFIVEYNYETNTWDKLEKDRSYKYPSFPHECVDYLLSNKGPLAWKSTPYAKDIYDTEDNEFIAMFSTDDLYASIKKVKNNVVCYSAFDSMGNISTFIYILPKNEK